MMCCRYLGLYENEIDAAKAYDMEAIKRRGVGAVTNFDLSTYLELLSEPCLSTQISVHSPCMVSWWLILQLMVASGQILCSGAST